MNGQGTTTARTTVRRTDRVMVTGAAGFIGSHVVDALLARGSTVVAADCRSPCADPVAAMNLADTATHPALTAVVADLAWYIDQVAQLQPGSAVPDITEVMETFCVIGTPTECGEAITELHTATGTTELVCVFGIGGAPLEMSRTAMRRFAEEIFPRMSLSGSPAPGAVRKVRAR